MTVTIKAMCTGQGVDYLLRTVGAGDGDRSLRDSRTRYSIGEATPEDGKHSCVCAGYLRASVERSGDGIAC